MMQKSITLHLNRATHAYMNVTASIENSITLTLSAETFMYARTRYAALTDIQRTLLHFRDGDVSNVISAITEEAARQLAGDLAMPVSANHILLGHQANVETLNKMRSELSRYLSSIDVEAAKLLRRGVSEKLADVTPSLIKLTGSVLDTTGKKWQGAAYFRTLLRKHFVDAYLNAYSAISSAMGHDVIILTYDDATHRNNGLKLSLQGISNYPTLDSKRRDAFHPNTQANLRVSQ